MSQIDCRLSGKATWETAFLFLDFHQNRSDIVPQGAPIGSDNDNKLLGTFAVCYNLLCMKTLLIDNGSTLTAKLAELSPGNETVVEHGNIPENLNEFSLIILSGSSKFPVNGNESLFTKEIELIRTTNIPIVGICFGHELIAHAFGAIKNIISYFSFASSLQP